MLLEFAIALLQPPAGFLVVAILGLLVLRRARRSGAALLCVGVAGLTVLAMPFASKSMIFALEAGLPLTAPPDHPPGAIVVLGGDMARHAPPAPQFDVGLLSLERERAGAALARRTGLPVLVAGGTLARGADPIAVLMARSLDADFGVQAKWVETRSRDTWENATFSAAMLRAAGIDSVFVVTQGWHMRRALLAFRDAGLRVTAAPTQIHLREPFTAVDFVPRATAWSDSYFALHEWIGLADYAYLR